MTVPKPAPRAQHNIEPAYRRRDIWMVCEDPEHPPIGTELWSNRPALIVSNDVSNRRSGFVQIVYMTTSSRKRSGPVHIDLGSPLADGRQSMALCEQIHTVDTSRLLRRIGQVGKTVMSEVDAAMTFALSIHADTRTNPMFRKWESHLKNTDADLAEEIAALSARTTDERVEALQRALKTVSAQRDAYKVLSESQQNIGDLLQTVEATLHDTPATEHPAAEQDDAA